MLRFAVPRLAVLAIAGTFAPVIARAQFTQQLVLVSPYESKDRRLAEAVSQNLRGRIQRLYNRREVRVIGGGEMSTLLERSSIEASSVDSIVTRQVARQLRADEIVYVMAERLGPQRVRVTSRLALVRDQRLRQPLPVVEARTPDSASALLAREIASVRRQLTPHRLCENHLREGRVTQAITAGRASIAEVPNGVFVRTCLVNALAEGGAPASDLWTEAKTLLDLFPESYWGLDAGARASDALTEKDRAADLWLRLARSDSSDMGLARRVVTSLLRGGNAVHAKPLIVGLSNGRPDDLELLRLHWQVLFTLKSWPEATLIGDRLYAEDPTSKGDSTFVQRLSSAHKSKGDLVKAIALAADGVSRFPKDALLYLLYSDLLQNDMKVVVDRGLERFPEMAEFHLMRAQELRRAGKNAEAIAPFQRAMALDPTMGQGYLALAQTQVDVGQLDSAWISTRRALEAGEPKGTVAAFALARGNALYKAANATRERPAYQLAFRFLSLADSVQSSPESRFLVGAVALAISQSAASDAPTTRQCSDSRLAEQMLPLAREKITAGAQVAVDAARQYLAYLDQLEPVIAQQIATLCVGPS
jgi:tetratricopeptide (TPR) repeat protein